jgi:hypothetical protein
MTDRYNYRKPEEHGMASSSRPDYRRIRPMVFPESFTGHMVLSLGKDWLQLWYR